MTSKKSSHSEAKYRLGTDARHCAICTMFRKPASCTAVVSPISANGDCDYFKRKGGRTLGERLIAAAREGRAIARQERKSK